MLHVTDISRDHADGLVALADRLAACGYLTLNDAYGYDELRTSALQFDLPLLPSDLADLGRFFALGEPIQSKRLVELVPDSTVLALEDLGIVEFDKDEVSIKAYRLAVFFGLPLFIEAASVNRQAYFDNDTLALGRLISTAKGSALDLCCGVGAQTALLGKMADSVVGVEKNSLLRPLFEVNMALNGMVDRCEFRCGDLLEPVDGDKFDLVVCNPPLIPVPKDVEFPVVGNGGALGTQFTLSIARNIGKNLTADGRLITVGTVLGDATGPFLTNVCNELRNQNLNCLVVLPFREEMRPGFPFFDALVRTASLHGSQRHGDVCDAYIQMTQCSAATHVYSFLLFASVGTQREPTTRMSHHYLRSGNFWSI